MRIPKFRYAGCSRQSHGALACIKVTAAQIQTDDISWPGWPCFQLSRRPPMSIERAHPRTAGPFILLALAIAKAFHELGTGAMAAPPKTRHASSRVGLAVAQAAGPVLINA
jgi:hypothetical protein